MEVDDVTPTDIDVVLDPVCLFTHVCKAAAAAKLKQLL